MHQYLRAVGFSQIESKKDLKEILNDMIVKSSQKDFLETDRNSILVEYSKFYSPSCGLTLRGELDGENNLTLDFYYPFVISDNISTKEDVTFERHADKESFAAVCEDMRVGMTLIYYVQNGMYLMKHLSDEIFLKSDVSTSLSALSLGGTIMLPIKKDPKVLEKIRKASADKQKRIIAAKKGDEEAIEQLTLEDIDTYSAVSKRILKDDIFTLVDSYFMPYGVECDHYSMLGEIEDYRLETNNYTNENVYILEINCNNLPITVCINEKDLLGKPEKGRRFRGNVWLQGRIGV